MINHISARLAWHDSGWNGHICKDPKKNVYCIGQNSYPGDFISEKRNINWEEKDNIKGNSCNSIDGIPPCVYSINAFGLEKIRAFSDPPDFFRDNSTRKEWDLPPATFCIWPYEEMYKEEVKYNQPGGQIYNYDVRLNLAKKYFDEMTSNESLIFYYANYSNPFNEGEFRKYVIVGISRLKSIGEILFYDNTSEENKRRYAGGFVWQRNITSHYPAEGFKIPYNLYIADEKDEELKKLLFIPENERNFKYATRFISDDDALDYIEHFIELVNYLIKIKDQSEDWQKRKTWLQSLIAQLWKNRGLFPGMPNILDYLEFQDCIDIYKKETLKNNELTIKENIFKLIEGSINELPGLNLKEKDLSNLRNRWKTKTAIEQKILKDIFSRIELKKDQIAKVLSDKRSENSIYETLDSIYTNPYILSEQFIGDNIDDKITFNKIDHSIIPSPELGLENLFDKDDTLRLRALISDRLKKESEHTFLPAEKIMEDINNRLSYMPEWKKTTFNINYLEINKNQLEEAIVIRQEGEEKYLYLKDIFEDERTVEQTIRNLAGLSDITLRIPVLEKDWHEFLFDSSCKIAKIDPPEYEKIIEKQTAVCKKIFNKSICVISGGAGTGKTTIIKALINAIERTQGSGTTFQLLAPTGKAVDRIREKTKRNANTIHSFLAHHNWLNNNITFKKKGGLEEQSYITYIIDEASMIDLELITTLFRSINWNSVKRLILVGDPNQLPPIGRGKVFSEIIDYLNVYYPGNIGILEENVRQKENVINKSGTGIIDLASIYYQEKNHEDDKSFKEIMFQKLQIGGDIDKDLRVVFWKDTDELEKMLLNIIVKDMETDTGKKLTDYKAPYELRKEAARDLYGNENPEYQQIITPYRGELFGVDNINLQIQKFYNKTNLDKRGSLGGITIFDKVIQYINRPKSNPYYSYSFKNQKNEKIEVYNGEIGYTIPAKEYSDKYKWKNYSNRIKKFHVIFYRKKDNLITLSSESDVTENLELAYAISVHKAQGSEFKRVYFILPKNKISLLSTELLYTAITRAEKHLTIFVEEDFYPFLSMSRPEKSHLSFINSSLFKFSPIPEEFLNIRKWYEEGKIHMTLADYMVRSKSEVIIANILYDRKIPFEYEVPLFASDGTHYLPDFTINFRGDQYYWEHIGLIDNEKYLKHWEEKNKWYEKNFPGKLITTKESTKLSKDVESILDKWFK